MTPYQLLVDFWLKEFKPDYCFRAVDGLKLKSIIKQIKHKLKVAGLPETDELIVQSFKSVCIKMPEYYKSKDLSVIDSKFNQIVDEIKANGNATKKIKSNAKAISNW